MMANWTARTHTLSNKPSAYKWNKKKLPRSRSRKWGRIEEKSEFNETTWWILDVEPSLLWCWLCAQRLRRKIGKRTNIFPPLVPCGTEFTDDGHGWWVAWSGFSSKLRYRSSPPPYRATSTTYMSHGSHKTTTVINAVSFNFLDYTDFLWCAVVPRIFNPPTPPLKN